MNNIKIKLKKMNPNAVVPTYAKQGDAAMDLYAAEVQKVKSPTLSTPLS